jgi:peptide/nickel transport system permease protein
MAAYIVRRLAYAILSVFLISIISFIVIELPEGDFATAYVARMSSSVSPERREQVMKNLRHRYGLDGPIHMRYFKWIWGILSEGDFGMSFNWNRPVSTLIKERLPLTIVIGLVTLFFQLVVAIPIGIYTAVKQHSAVDYFFTFVSFFGKSVPSFLLALIIMVFLFNVLGFSIGGLFSGEYETAPWSVAKVIDMLKHLIVPVVVIGAAGTANTVRVLRATMLDELGKEYVRVARAKGLSEFKLILKYPVRLALNPVISAVGWQLPMIISGAVIVSLVVNLPTTGPILYEALMSQDMYLAGAFVLMLSTLTILGTLISDILLAISDARISFQ